MIRLVQRKLIIPRGDTGSFSIPVLPNTNSGDIAVFSILNPLKHERLFDKEIKEFDNSLQIRFTHEETVNLPAGQYNWDIKLYRNPVIENNILVSGEEIDSYYAAFSLPICEIRETGDNYIISPDAPNSYLRPDQIEIITGAIAALNAAVEKTEQNVEHYPKIIDEQWYTWDAENGEYVATGVSANGNTGNGIESVVLNNDYTLTLNFTDGTSYTTTSIRGTTGNGIEDIVLNSDYTLTIVYSDGNSYTTPSIRGPIGPTPQFSIGTVQEGAAAAATITGTAENPVLNLTLSNANVPTRVSQLENDSGYLSVETDPTVPAWAKAANKPAYTAAEVGAPTIAEMNTAIGEAIGQINSFDMAIVQTLPTQDISTHTIYLVPKTGETNDVYDEYVYINNAWEMVGNTQIDLNDYALKSELPTKVSDLTDDSGHYTKPANGIPASDLANGVIPTVPVQDVQINGASVIQNGIANVPIAGMKLGAVRVAATNGIDINSTYGILSLSQTTDAMIKAGTSVYAISPKTQHAAAFYGLAKAAGDTTQAASDNAVGTYTTAAKAAIQTMLGVPDISDIPEVPVQDVKISTTSILSNGVATIPIAHTGRYGAVKAATDVEAKAGAASGIVVSTWGQHASTFYGLTKAAGVDMASSSNPVGQYTDEAKVAIQKMLGVYEAPWELIREDTVTNATEADIEITVDGNGQAFELTDVLIVLIVPTHSGDTTIGDYGRIYFYNNDNEIRRIYVLNAANKLVQANSVPQIAIARLLNDHGLMSIDFYQWTAQSNRAALQIVPNSESNGLSTQFAIYTNFITKIKIGGITGKLQYRLYGKRKWNQKGALTWHATSSS